MNYKKLYDSIILSAQERKTTLGYIEKHHVQPKSLGGSDDSSNIVVLSAREHFLCHYLLSKMYKQQTTKWYKMNHAFLMMICNATQRRYMNSRLYEASKKKFSLTMSYAQTGNRNSQFGMRWINNPKLCISKKIRKLELIPTGWKEGRVVKWNNKTCKCCGRTYNGPSVFCSGECKTQYNINKQIKTNASKQELLNTIANNHSIVFCSIHENKEFIIEANSAGLSLRSICLFLQCNDSGGNYHTIKNNILS